MSENVRVTVSNEKRWCLASGIEYRIGGGEYIVEAPHLLFPEQRRDAKFCSDRCRNLYRDTRPRRLRQLAVELGGVLEGYELIPNYRNSGVTVQVSKKSGRIVR
jgi:hypothetical protein